MRRVSRNQPTLGGLLGLAGVLLFGLPIACQSKLPTAPSELTMGIAIYEHANFLGGSSSVERDISDLRDVSGPCEHETTSYSPSGFPTTTTYRDWNDCISSIRVAPGWRATVYRGIGFDGDSMDLTQDVANLQLVQGTCSGDGLNDCISSMRVRQQ